MHTGAGSSVRLGAGIMPGPAGETEFPERRVPRPGFNLRRGSRGAAVLAALLLLPATLASAASKSEGEWRAGDSFSFRKAIPAGKTIEIKGINGSISATATSGAEVQVEATRRAQKSDPASVTIEVIEHADGITLCAKYPTPPGEDENECAPGGGGRMNTRNNDVQVNFQVKVPAGVRLAARTVNGDVDADGLKAPVEAATVNGSVQVSTSSWASAATVNGSIVADMGSAALPDDIEFSTVNGRIRITLPSSVNADVRVETVNGTIDTDFPITVRGKFGKQRLQGTIGKGGRRIDAQTVNGNVALRAASSQ